jgi:hypothetical protein
VERTLLSVAFDFELGSDFAFDFAFAFAFDFRCHPEEAESLANASDSRRRTYATRRHLNLGGWPSPPLLFADTILSEDRPVFAVFEDWPARS